MSEQQASALVRPDGRPARQVQDDNCPKCRAPKERRRRPGFGQPHDICGECGYDFPPEPTR